jgi:hypothetical protein
MRRPRLISSRGAIAPDSRASAIPRSQCSTEMAAALALTAPAPASAQEPRVPSRRTRHANHAARAVMRTT